MQSTTCFDKNFDMMNSQIGIFVFINVLIQGLWMAICVNFNKELTGVELGPYIAPFSITKESYTPQNVKTMLEVISTRFSRVIIREVDLQEVPYRRNETYYHNTFARARTAEMAAIINRERRNLSLTVTVGITIWYTDYTKRNPYREMDIALEATQIAQSIFPGTVKEIVIWNWKGSLPSSDSHVKEMISYIKTVRKKSYNLRLRIGMFQNHCEDSFGRSAVRMGSIDTGTLIRQLLFSLDFIICQNILDTSMFANTSTRIAFNSIVPEVLARRDEIRDIDKNIQVTWCSAWPFSSRRYQNNLTDFYRGMRDYWLLANKFATQNSYPVWLLTAVQLYGWWRLDQDDQINNASAYVEQISTLPDTFEDLESDRIEENQTVSTKPNNNTDGKDENTFWKYFAVIIGAIFSTTVIIAAFAYVAHRQLSLSRFRILEKHEVDEFRHGVAQDVFQEIGEDNFVNSTALKQPYDKSLEIPKEKLDILFGQMLGGGEFGCVFKALLKDEAENEKEVALKTTKPNASANTVKGFLSEIKILTYLGHHANIVPILGAYTAEVHKGTVYIATELCPLGSLKTCLKNCREARVAQNLSSIPLNDMLRWSYEIACGMEYLEEKAVIHADLATRNVLLSSESTAKISDFGLSRRLYEYTNYTKTSQEPLPWRWMAFESLKTMKFSSKSDVWSYGVTLWEIFSLGAQPYPGIGWTLDFVESLECGFRLMKPEFASSDIFEIMGKCWILDSNARPSFAELKNFTRGIQTTTADRHYTLLDTYI